MPAPGPVLLICHTFPPYRGIGGRRWAKFAKELAQRGHPVHVICADPGGDMKGSPWTSDVDHPNISVHALPMRYPKVLMKRPLTTFWEKLQYHFWVRSLPRIVNGNPYDKAIRWGKPMLRVASALIRKYHIRHVLTTGAPFMVPAHAVELKREHDITLLSDLRDPWTWGHVYGRANLSEKRREFEKRMERKVMMESDIVLSPHVPVIDHVRTHYPNTHAQLAHIPHAVDPDEMPTDGPGLRGDGPRLVYAGSMYGAQQAQQYFRELIKAFNVAREQRPDVLQKVCFDLYITGHDVGWYQDQVAQAGLQDHIRFHAPLPSSEVLKKVAQADAVLMFIPTINKDLIGTKFTELFYLRKPIIHVGDEGLVSRTITENRLGTSMLLEDLHKLLPPILLSERTVSTDPGSDVDRFRLDRLTDQLLDLLSLG